MKMELWRPRKNSRYIILVAIAVIVLISVMWISYVRTDYEKKVLEDLTLCTMVDGQEFELRLWQDEKEEKYYLFLPSCFSNQEITFSVHYEDSFNKLMIDGQKYADGDVWDEIKGESTYQIKVVNVFGKVYMEKNVQVLISENLPTILVSVPDQEDMQSSKEFANKKYLESGNMLLLDEEGNCLCQEDMQIFKVRGNLTATLGKKPYTIAFSEPVSLLGMEQGLKWNLLANATDGSYIRNKTILDIANVASNSYEPDGEFTELYLNGMYQGLYLLTEAVSIEEDRVNISTSDEWLIEMELDFRMEDGKPYVTTQAGQIFEIKTEDWISEDEKQAVLDRLNDIESALYAKDGISKISGKHLQESIDFDSWAKAWLIEEISGDHDAGIASQFAYMSKDDDSLLVAGPVWDFDGTMGNVHTAMFSNPIALTTSIVNSRTDGDANQNRWLAAMYQNPEFRKVLEQKYIAIYKNVLKETLDKRIISYTEQIHRAAVLDTLRWHAQCFEWMFVLPDNLVILEDGDYTRYDVLDSQLEMVTNFLSAKYIFLNQLFVEHRNFCVVTVENNAPFHNPDYNYTMYYWVEQGTTISGLQSYEAEGYQFKGYFDKTSGQEVNNDTIIYEDSVLEGIWEKVGE